MQDGAGEVIRGALLLLAACIVEVRVGDDPLGIDDDGDGFSEKQGDCDDTAPEIAPGAVETCDGRDDDCDGVVDGGACARAESFPSIPRVDVLLVIDDSPTMGEEQGRIAAALPDLAQYFAGDDRDVHVGVITPDMDDPEAQGQLVLHDGARWVAADAGVDAVTDWLVGAVALGIGGSPVEQARAAVHSALTTQLDGVNAGFRRADADLALVIASDADDESAVPTLTQFVTWLDEAPGLDRVGVHAIVGTEALDPCASAFGQQHLDLVALTGGTALSVCEPDYGPFLAAVGQVVIQDALPRRFPLADPAEPASISVELLLDGGFVDVMGADEILYDATAQEVVLVERPAPAGALVQVSYDAVPESAPNP